MFYVKLNDNYDIIKIELNLSLIDNTSKAIDCKIYNAYNSNFLCIKYYKKINLTSVNNNLNDIEDNIASNSYTTKNNDYDIAYNLREINIIKNKTFL